MPLLHWKTPKPSWCVEAAQIALTRSVLQPKSSENAQTIRDLRPMQGLRPNRMLLLVLHVVTRVDLTLLAPCLRPRARTIRQLIAALAVLARRHPFPGVPGSLSSGNTGPTCRRSRTPKCHARGSWLRRPSEAFKL